MQRLMTGLLAAALLVCACGPGIVARPASTAHAAPGKWSLQHTPGASGRTLLSVSCASATTCTATGTAIANGINRTVAETWHQAAWTLEPAPTIPGGTDGFLRGVSCPSAASCTAVGDYSNGAANVTLAEGWNGTRWSIEPTPNPPGSRGNYLFAISCPAAGSCTAVGDFIARTGAQMTLAEHWNGSAWSIQPTPRLPGHQQGILFGVSCAAPDACTAVGLSSMPSGASRTLAEAWNGSAWSIQATPNVPGAQLNSLVAVSCSAASACTAVGNDSASTSSTLSLAEVWHGSAWSIQPTPNPPSAANTYLSGVSCTSAMACTASGYFVTRGRADVSVAMGWNGSRWSIQHAVRPASAAASFLNGVSCTAAADCTAVGDYTTGTPLQVALAERHSAG
jgi:hypothetical protein